MEQRTQSFAHSRGECIDLHIVALRDRAESSYGQIFADAVKLRRKLNDSSLPDNEYDADIIGLICSTITTIRPMPSPLRSCLGALLAVELADRAKLINVSSPNAPKKEMRSDIAWADLVITSLQIGLYPPKSYMASLTDIRSGLEGLHLTLRKDITIEADCHGVISVEGVRRIQNKLARSVAETGDRRLTNERQLELLEIVEHAASIGSPLVCIPSRVREDRITRTNI